VLSSAGSRGLLHGEPPREPSRICGRGGWGGSRPAGYRSSRALRQQQELVLPEAVLSGRGIEPRVALPAKEVLESRKKD